MFQDSGFTLAVFDDDDLDGRFLGDFNLETKGSGKILQTSSAHNGKRRPVKRECWDPQKVCSASAKQGMTMGCGATEPSDWPPP